MSKQITLNVAPTSEKIVGINFINCLKDILDGAKKIDDISVIYLTGIKETLDIAETIDTVTAILNKKRAGKTFFDKLREMASYNEKGSGFVRILYSHHFRRTLIAYTPHRIILKLQQLQAKKMLIQLEGDYTFPEEVNWTDDINRYKNKKNKKKISSLAA